MNDLRIQLRLLTEARRDRLFVLARREGVSPSDWLRGAIDRAGKWVGRPQDECPQFDPHYGECRMADGSNPKCHPHHRASAPRNAETPQPTHDQHGRLIGPPRGR